MEDLYTLRGNNVSIDNKIKGLITSIHFNCIGNVSKVYNKGYRIDVTLPYLNVNNEPITLKGVEVVRPGTHRVKIDYIPEIGDVALVFATQNYNGSGKFAQPTLPKDNCPYFDPYGDCTLKAILVQTNEDNSSAINITIRDTAITVDCPSSVSINCKDTTDITIDNASTIHCKDTATVTVDKKASITCNDETSISCAKKVDISASNANINITASQLNVNNGHLVVT